MTESVTFWLDNRSSSGTLLARHGNQTLVSYRERYYVVENGAAMTKGGKPLRYSKSSLPALWRKVLRGDAPPVEDFAPLLLERKRAPRKRSTKKNTEVSAMPTEPVKPENPQTAPATSSQSQPQKARKTAAKTPLQSQVAAECPYCGQKQEIPVEKGRGGRPFFQNCGKCKSDFAVRFVQVTMLQAQVAGFR